MKLEAHARAAEREKKENRVRKRDGRLRNRSWRRFSREGGKRTQINDRLANLLVTGLLVGALLVAAAASNSHFIKCDTSYFPRKWESGMGERAFFESRCITGTSSIFAGESIGERGAHARAIDRRRTPNSALDHYNEFTPHSFRWKREKR